MKAPTASARTKASGARKLAEIRADKRLADGAAKQAKKLRAAASKEKDPDRRKGFERAADTYQAVADAKRRENTNAAAREKRRK